MILCELKHKKHKTKVVDTYNGLMTVYDWDKYKDHPGVYCSGQDDVSRTLINTGVWSPTETVLVQHILTKGDKNRIFVDIGCHIGWFSKVALYYGYSVSAFDGDPSHLELFEKNVPQLIGIPNAKATLLWFDDKTLPEAVASDSLDIELVKIDIEGNEKFAIQWLENYLKAGKIHNILMEVSPVFNDSYPELVKKIFDYGFIVREVDRTPFNFKYDFDQKDLWFEKK